MCAAAIKLAGFSVAMPVHAQDPLPRAFAHDVLHGGVTTGAPNAGEPALGLDPLDPWDFYSVPLPALFAAANPVGLHPDNYVASEDGQAVMGYFKRGARIGSPDYVADLNWNNIEDGLEYDRTVLGPDESGPPDGVIAASDAQLAFAQFRAHFVC